MEKQTHFLTGAVVVFCPPPGEGSWSLMEVIIVGSQLQVGKKKK